MDICLQVLKESHNNRFDSYSVRNSELIVSHITFRNCRVHNFSNNLPRNSCISSCSCTYNTKYNRKIAITAPKWPEKETDSKRYNKQVSQNLFIPIYPLTKFKFKRIRRINCYYSSLVFCCGNATTFYFKASEDIGLYYLSAIARNLVYFILYLHLLCCLFAYFLRGRRFSKPLKIHSVTNTAEMLGIVVHENMKLGDNNYNEWLLAVST